MNIEIKVEKRHLLYLALTLAILTVINYSIAQADYNTFGHSADNIGPGTFAAGTYTFPTGSKVNVQGTLDVSGELDVGGDVTANAFYYSSDRGLKENIGDIPDALERILELEGVSFTWRDSGEQCVGLIAQDVEGTFPELVSTDEETGLKSVSYGNLVAVLVEALKEQQEQIEELQAELRELKLNH